MHTLRPLVVEFHLLLKHFEFVHLNVLGLVVFTKVVALLCAALVALFQCSSYRQFDIACQQRTRAREVA